MVRHVNDTQVIARPERFDVFYQREFRAVVGLAYALPGSRLAAEDLAHFVVKAKNETTYEKYAFEFVSLAG